MIHLQHWLSQNSFSFQIIKGHLMRIVVIAWSLEQILNLLYVRFRVPTMVFNQHYYKMLWHHSYQRAVWVNNCKCVETVVSFQLHQLFHRTYWLNHFQTLASFAKKLSQHIFNSYFSALFWQVIPQYWHLLTSNCILIKWSIEYSTYAMSYHDTYQNRQKHVNRLSGLHH